LQKSVPLVAKIISKILAFVLANLALDFDSVPDRKAYKFQEQFRFKG
jgi:hypothetical protein